MLKNDIEVDVKVKCIEAKTTQAKLAEDAGGYPVLCEPAGKEK